MPLSENLVFIANSGMKNLVSNSLSSGLRSILEKLGNRCLFVLNIPDSIRSLSLSLALFLEREHIAYAMVPALDIKRSLGITRGKNDQIDAKRIAEFAYRFNDRVMPTSLPCQGYQETSFFAGNTRQDDEKYGWLYYLSKRIV